MQTPGRPCEDLKPGARVSEGGRASGPPAPQLQGQWAPPGQRAGQAEELSGGAHARGCHHRTSPHRCQGLLCTNLCAERTVLDFPDICFRQRVA